jgi:hypothetical protein
MTVALQSTRRATKRSGIGSIRPNGSGLIRLCGLAAVCGGLIFAGIQPIHPPDVLASVTTSGWSFVLSLKFLMCLLFIIGVGGLYARQVEESGWLGFVGFLLIIVSFWLQTGFVFVELFVLPVMAAAAPAFVDSYLGIVNGSPGTIDIGALVPTYGVLAVCYLLGGLVFGIATVRANVLPRWPAILLALAAVITPAAALLPHEIQRFAAIPMGAALASLGVALWTERAALPAKIGTARTLHQFRPVDDDDNRLA